MPLKSKPKTRKAKPPKRERTRSSDSLERLVRPTRAMKLKALVDVKAWPGEYSHVKDGRYSDLVEERANFDEAQYEAWRKAYEWVHDLLWKAEAKFSRPNAAGEPLT